MKTPGSKASIRKLPQSAIHNQVMQMVTQRINPTKPQYIYQKRTCNACICNNPDYPPSIAQQQKQTAKEREVGGVILFEEAKPSQEKTGRLSLVHGVNHCSWGSSAQHQSR